MEFILHNPWELVTRSSRGPDSASSLNSDGVRSFAPAVDIVEENERFVVEADIPGIDPADIEITVEGDLLTLKGQRDSKVPEDGARPSRQERASGAFERAFRLPESAASEGIEADYALGVLRISIPKPGKPSPYRIEVTAH